MQIPATKPETHRRWNEISSDGVLFPNDADRGGRLQANLSGNEKALGAGTLKAS
jgi:hypothetical protein